MHARKPQTSSSTSSVVPPFCMGYISVIVGSGLLLSCSGVFTALISEVGRWGSSYLMAWAPDNAVGQPRRSAALPRHSPAAARCCRYEQVAHSAFDWRTTGPARWRSSGLRISRSSCCPHDCLGLLQTRYCALLSDDP